MPELNPKNLCRKCGLDFSSLAYFDAHHVGDMHLGWVSYPDNPDGLRCLDEEELTERGFALDKHGRWTDPKKAAETRAAFAAVASAQ